VEGTVFHILLCEQPGDMGLKLLGGAEEKI
jgi:hypothetical protein